MLSADESCGGAGPIEGKHLEEASCCALAGAVILQGQILIKKLLPLEKVLEKSGFASAARHILHSSQRTYKEKDVEKRDQIPRLEKCG